MFCTNCGTKNEDGILICTGCGAELIPEEPTPAPVIEAPAQPEAPLDPQRKFYRMVGMMAVGVVAVLLLSVLAFLFI